MSDVPSYLQPNEAVGLPSASTPTGPALDISAGVPSSQVFDPSTNKVLHIPHDDLEVAIRSGKYQALPDVNYGVKDTHGIIADVSGKDLASALQGNATIAAQDEISKYRNTQKYGDSEALAGLEGFNRGALPGVADRMTAGGKDFQGNSITQADLAGRAEANPISAGVGELAGAVFSPINKILGPGSAAVEAGAAKTLTKIAGKAGFSNKVAQAIVSKVIPAAAGSAVEGAYFGAAHLLNEDALGTAQFNAENLLASVEQGALWGAAFGGGMSVSGMAVKGAASAISESRAGAYVSETFENSSKALNNKVKAAREFLGIKPKLAQKLADKDPEFMGDAIKFTQEVLESNPNANITDVAHKVTSDLEVVGKRIGKIYDDVDKFSAEKGLSHTIATKDLKLKIASELDEKIMPKFDGVEGMKSQIKQVNQTINEIFDSAATADGNMTVKELHKAMKNIDDQLYKDKSMFPGARTLTQEMLEVQRGVVRTELNTAVEKASIAHPELRGLNISLEESNRRFRTLTRLEKTTGDRAYEDANKGFLSYTQERAGLMGAVVNPTLGAASVLIKKFTDSDMLRKMQILGKIEKFQQQTASAVASGFKTIGKVAAKSEPLIVKSLVDSHLSSELVDGKKKKADDEQQAYRNILANAKFAAENPEQFLQGVNKYSSHLYAVAPKTSGALDTAALNAMVYLHSKAPKSTKVKGFFDAGKPDRASGLELLQMQQRVDMIQHPSKAVHLLGKGKLGATHIETVKAVYPQLHAEMQKQAMHFLSGKTAAGLSYPQKLNMGMLLGVQADESMHYENVLGLQSNFKTEGADAASDGAVKPTQGGLSKVNKSKRMNTDESDDT